MARRRHNPVLNLPSPEENHERALQKEAILRERAFEDFVQLGANRTKAALLRQYQETARRDGKGSVPTTNSSTLTRWSREDNWVERAQERDREGVKKDRVLYEKVRKDRLTDLHNLSEDAIRTLTELLTSETTPPNVRKEVSIAILDRIGLTPQRGLQTGENQQQIAFTPPPSDAPEDSYIILLDEVRKQRQKPK